LIRYGVMAYVGRFWVAPECDSPLERGQSVVIQTDRGIELGEVLIPLDGSGAAKAVDGRRVLRPAGPDDLDRSRRAEASRSDRFAVCHRVLEEEGWPWDVLDVEPLLEDGVTVIQYLGPHQLDVAAIRARLRMTCGLDVVLEPVGTDLDETEDSARAALGGCGSGGCGSGGVCGSGGGCGSPNGAEAEVSGPGCGSSAHSGCASCGLSRLAKERGRRPAVSTA
jgi:hypothetical protein